MVSGCQQTSLRGKRSGCNTSGNRGEWRIIRTVSRTVMPRPLKVTTPNATTITKVRRGVLMMSVTSPVSTLIDVVMTLKEEGLSLMTSVNR